MEPVVISPNGPRFSVQGRKVTYFNWQFDYLVQISTGPGIFDVRYNNKRIGYQISLQEAASYYSTGEPSVSHGNYLDSIFFLGTATSLIRGIDCPRHSLYFDKHYYNINTGRSQTVKDAVCIFELNTGTPLRRHHHSYEYGYIYGGMAYAVLVIRFITDLFNYDYITDFIFHQTGSIEVKSISTGHLSLQYYYEQNENKYGFEVFENNLAGVHDHFMLFKVDLDIIGSKNSFKTLDLT